MAAFIYRTHLVGELNDLHTQIRDLQEKLKVLKKYRKVKHIGEELKALSGKDEKKYRKERSGEIAEYYETRKQVFELYPSGTIPKCCVNSSPFSPSQLTYRVPDVINLLPSSSLFYGNVV